VLAGRTDAVTIGLFGVAVNLIFRPNSSFTPSNYLGFTAGLAGDLGLSFSKDNTILVQPQKGSCGH